MRIILTLFMFIFLIASNSYGAFGMWTFYELTGGGAALDGRSSASIEDDDIAYGISDTYGKMAYLYAAASTATESVPDIIAPNDSTTTGRWILIDGADGTPEGTAILSTGETGGVKFLREDGDGTSSWQTPAGAGDVVGPSSSVDNEIPIFDGVTGKLLDGSGAIIDSSGLTLPAVILPTDSFIDSDSLDLDQTIAQIYANTTDTTAGAVVSDVTFTYKDGTNASGVFSTFMSMDGSENQLNFPVDVSHTGAFDTSGTSSNTTGPLTFTPTATLPTAVDGKAFIYTGATGFLGNSILSFYDDTTPVYGLGFETLPTTTGDYLSFNSVTGKWDVSSAPTAGSFAFDTYPVYEDSAHNSGIAVNATTLAVYSASAAKWLTVGLTDSLDPTPVTPTLTTWTEATTGILSTLVFSAPVTATDFSGVATVLPSHTLTYVSGDGTDTLTFSHDTIYSTATDNPTGSFTSPGATGLQAVTGGALLADFTGFTIDNQSTQLSTYSLTLTIVSDGTITINSTDYTSSGSPHTITGLSGDVTITGAYGGSNDTLTWTGDTVTGSYSTYTLAMGTADKSITGTFSVASTGADYQWNFDDNAATTTVLASAGGVDGTLVGAGNTADIYSTEDLGEGGSLLLVDSSYVSVPTGTGIATMMDDGIFTAEFVIKTDGTPQTTFTRFMGDSNASGTVIRMNGNTTVRVVINSTNYDYTCTDVTDGGKHIIRVAFNYSAGSNEIQVWENVNDAGYTSIGTTATISTLGVTGGTKTLYGYTTNSWSGYSGPFKLWNNVETP